MNSENFIAVDNVFKYFGTGENRLAASDGIEFNVQKGEFCVILGPSGAGKTTILNLLGGMDTCDGGNLLVDGQNIATYNDKQLTAYRRNDVGFVFQFYNLMPNLTALENVEIAAELCKNHYDSKETLKKVGLERQFNNFPSQLSGGEQQRVAIARALAKNPKLLLCDEPTGALDYQTGKQVLKALSDTCKTTKMTTIVITHNHIISKMADHVILIKNGKVVEENFTSHPSKIEELEW